MSLELEEWNFTAATAISPAEERAATAFLAEKSSGGGDGGPAPYRDPWEAQPAEGGQEAPERELRAILHLVMQRLAILEAQVAALRRRAYPQEAVLTQASREESLGMGRLNEQPALAGGTSEVTEVPPSPLVLAEYRQRRRQLAGPEPASLADESRSGN